MQELLRMRRSPLRQLLLSLQDKRKMAVFSCFMGPKVIILHASMKIITLGFWHPVIKIFKKGD